MSSSPPRSLRDLLKKPNQRIFIAEGITRVDALASFGIAAVGILGVNSWKSGKPPVALPDFDSLGIKGNRFYIAVDGDVRTNRKVASAAFGLLRFLKGKGADQVDIISLPDGLGLDDWIAREKFSDAGKLREAVKHYILPDKALPAAIPKAKPGEPEVRSHVQQIAAHCAELVRGWVRFDNSLWDWWLWDVNHWRVARSLQEITDHLNAHRLRIAGELESKGMIHHAQMVADAKHWGGGLYRKDGEWWSEFRQQLERPPPAPPDGQVATPEGVVDLRTGEMESHDSATHDTLAVTAGRYRPEDAEELSGKLYGRRLRHNISEEDYKALLQLMGLGLARRAQQQRSIVWLYGVSGSGKGMTKNLIGQAFGGFVGEATLAMLERRQNDIDADMADLLERDPCFILCDELGGSSIKQGKLFALTGNSKYRARRPHQRIPFNRVLRAIWVAPTTDPPKMSTSRDLRRRSAAIGFEQAYDQGNPNEDFSQDELDAMVTSAIIEAKKVFEPGYEAPVGNLRRRAQLLEAADHALEWIEALPSDDYAGMLTEAVHKEYTEEGDSVEINLSHFGRKVNESTRWETWKPKRGAKAQLRLKQPRLSGVDEADHG